VERRNAGLLARGAVEPVIVVETDVRDDVIGLPIERQWSVVNLSARLSAAAAACRDFLAAHAEAAAP